MLKSRLRIIGLTLGAFALPFTTSCAYSAPAEAQSTPAVADAPAPALWMVSDEDTTIYLFGTVHALPRDLEWYNPHIAQALEASGEFITEVDMEDTSSMAGMIAEKAMMTDGQRLRELMSDEDRMAYDEMLVSLGLPVESFDMFKPWFAAVTLSLLPLLNEGYDTESGAEMVLLSKIGPEIPRGELETAEFQLDLFDSLPLETQLDYLNSVVEAAPDLKNQLDQMVAEWLEGDADSLAELMNATETDPALYQKLIVDRNANWVEWIDTRLDQPGTVFVAVGAGHLAGEGSVQDLLEDRGILSARVH